MHMISKITYSISRRLRYMILKEKLNSYNGFFYIDKNVDNNNPHCIFIGNKVVIGNYTFMEIVVNYAIETYSHIISIRDNTIIRQHCSIAAINEVIIGKNTLFANYVHITDHSHGYEDINRPITLRDCLVIVLSLLKRIVG